MFNSITFITASFMKINYARLICICAVQLFTAGLANAQNKSEIKTLQSPPSGIIVDGNLRDWGDSLRYLNADKHIDYSLANDKDNLYMAIRINDYGEQIMILNAGLTLSIDTHGGKKERFSITFPVSEQGGLTGFGIPKKGNADSVKEDRDELIEARLTKLRGIKVVGFTDIEGTQITTSNTYGIQTAIDYDKDGYLVLEAAIPLKFFHADDLIKNEWAFDFKINGISRPSQNNNSDAGAGGGGGRGGRGFGGGGGGRGGGRGGRGGQHSIGDQQTDRSEMSKSIDFWEKFYLAK
jgi:uncharacterized membrane protein YgcG